MQPASLWMEREEKMRERKGGEGRGKPACPALLSCSFSFSSSSSSSSFDFNSSIMTVTVTVTVAVALNFDRNRDHDPLANRTQNFSPAANLQQPNEWTCRLISFHGPYSSRFLLSLISNNQTSEM